VVRLTAHPPRTLQCDEVRKTRQAIVGFFCMWAENPAAAISYMHLHGADISSRAYNKIKKLTGKTVN